MELNASAVERIGEGIETLDRGAIISFAELNVDLMTILGAGGFARVYKGSYNGEPAAFKLMVRRH